MIKNLYISFKNFYLFLNLDLKYKKYVFFTESSFYRYYYYDFLNSLLNYEKEGIILVTSDKKEEEFFRSRVKSLYIGSYFFLSLFFITLKCKYMIMTLTDLGNHFRKSKDCENYIYYFHALGSTHEIYTKTAFKNYDMILCNGEYQANELRLAEKNYNFPKKEIVNVGYFFLDYLAKKANHYSKIDRNILFAPSWNYSKSNLFDDHSVDIIENLLSNGFIVTLRPHPEHYKRSRETLKKIRNLFSNDKNFNLDDNESNLKSLETSEILVTDNSAIVFEFIFIFKRPIVYINYKHKIHNLERNKIALTTIDEKLKNKFGNIIDSKNINELHLLCEKLMIDRGFSESELTEFKNRHIANIGTAAEFAAEYLINKNL